MEFKPRTSAGEEQRFSAAKRLSLVSSFTLSPGLATWHSGMQRIRPSIPILKLKTENRQEAGHSIFCALVNNDLYHGIIEIKEGLADVTTLKAWKCRQVLLKLPADDREHTSPPSPGRSWELLTVLEEMLRARANSEPEEHLPPLFFEDSFPHPSSFKIVCGSDI